MEIRLLIIYIIFREFGEKVGFSICFVLSEFCQNFASLLRRYGFGVRGKKEKNDVHRYEITRWIVVEDSE